MRPRYDTNGILSFYFVLPSENLRWLVYDRLRAAYPELNYTIGWDDAHGYGLMMSVGVDRYGVDRYHDGTRSFR